MTEETVFRLACLSALVPAGLVRDYHWWTRGYLRSGSRSEIVRETRRSNRENLSSTLPLGIVVSLCFTGIFAYIISPRVMAWSTVEIPRARFAGQGRYSAGWPRSAPMRGTNIWAAAQDSPILRIKKEHSWDSA